MEKPHFLFHGSCKGIEGDLTPRPQDGDVNGKFPEGKRKVVFATDDQSLAALYSLKNQHMLAAGLCSGEDYQHHFGIFRDYEGWKEELSNAQCNVYALPSDSFTNTILKNGQPSVEWQSRVAVSPDHIIHQTPEMVMEKGVQLFFLDKKVSGKLYHYDKDADPTSSLQNRLVAKQKAGRLPKSFTVLNLARELSDAGLLTHLNAECGIEPLELPKSPYAYIVKEDIDWLKQKILEQSVPQGTRRNWTATLGNRTGQALG